MVEVPVAGMGPCENPIALADGSWQAGAPKIIMDITAKREGKALDSAKSSEAPRVVGIQPKKAIGIQPKKVLGIQPQYLDIQNQAAWRLALKHLISQIPLVHQLPLWSGSSDNLPTAAGQS